MATGKRLAPLHSPFFISLLDRAAHAYNSSHQARSGTVGGTPSISSGEYRVRLLAMVIVPSLALMLSGCGGLSRAERHYNAGVDLGNQKQIEEAIAEYSEAIRLNPGHDMG